MNRADVSAVALRRATTADWPAIEALLAGAGLPLSGARDHLDHFIVAAGPGVIGCVGLECYGDAGLLRSLAVDAAYRGTGIGSTLANACAEHARAAGVQTLVLLTETAESFFARRGFRRVERAMVPEAVRASTEFRGACPASAVAMVCNLSAADRRT